MLEIEDLHAYYGDSHVIQGVSLAVGASECVALLGRNGAGKSTTLKAVVGLVPRAGAKLSSVGAISKGCRHIGSRVPVSHMSPKIAESFHP